MRFIKWESDLYGSLAYIKESSVASAVAESGDYNFSLSSATYLVSALMHELDIISAEFEDDDYRVYSLLASASVLDGEDMVFYALYGSGTANHYCVRKALWKKSTGNIEAVISELNAKTIFFHDGNLNNAIKNILYLIDGPIEGYSNFDNTDVDHAMFVNKDICYSISSDSEEFFYRSKITAIDNKLELLFCGIELIYSTLNTSNSLKAVPESFRVSYSFNTISTWFGRLKQQGGFNPEVRQPA